MDGFISEETRCAMRSYWEEHSRDPTEAEMLCDSNPNELSNHEVGLFHHQFPLILFWVQQKLSLLSFSPSSVCKACGLWLNARGVRLFITEHYL